MVAKSSAACLLLALQGVAVTVFDSKAVVDYKAVVRKTRNTVLPSAAVTLKMCNTQHPAERSDIANMTLEQILDCYAQWHDATLASWRKEPEKCDGRYTRVRRADHGLGDSGSAFVGQFREAVRRGEMIFFLFNGDAPSIWELAMVPPFDWNLRKNKDLLCLSDDHLSKIKPVDFVVANCPDCVDPRKSRHTTTAFERLPDRADKFKSGIKAMWKFLYRPTQDVQDVVQSVLGQVKPDERLVGVHFRAQWFGSHFACACADVQEHAKCMLNIGNVMYQRGVAGFEDHSKLRYFVASDENDGVDAFREAFGQDVLTLPDKMPVEHSLNVSAEGAKRVFAEFLIISKANAIIGTCGSTFTAGVMGLSGLNEKATLTTGTPESRACAANAAPHDLKAFYFDRFANGHSWNAGCGCYGAKDSMHGPAACSHEWQASHQPQSLLAEVKRIHTKPRWVNQHRRGA